MDEVQRRALERLQDLQAELEGVTIAWRDARLSEWQREARAALERLVPDSGHLREFNATPFGPPIITQATTDDDWRQWFWMGIEDMKSLLRSVIKEVTDYDVQTANPGGVRPHGDVIGGEVARAFIVHGRDNEMKESVARFLERLGVTPIILHEQANAGATIIEKIENNSNVQFAVVLLSPDDVGALASEKRKLRPRARQNVLLELGYFIGRLARNRVCAIVRGDLEVPSDFGGVAYVPFDGDTWKLAIVRELKNLGYPVDANKAF
jgi:hypothetical protein